ncbi:hypothetical protein IFR05_006251 [Cadophora sp. M221]|nr:hypothetical protein IFR05_006251 [Cadophora sp. M221]
MILGRLGNSRAKVLDFPDALGRTPIHYAALRHNSRVLRMLLNARASLNSAQYDEKNLLHLSARVANKRCFEMLINRLKLQSQDDLRRLLNQKDCNGETPLHAFLGSNADDKTTNKSKGSQDSNAWRIFHKIKSYISNLDAVDRSGSTALHSLLIFNGFMSQTAKEMVKRGADPQKPGINGATALHIGLCFSSEAFLVIIMQDFSLYTTSDGNGVKEHLKLAWKAKAAEKLVERITSQN